MMNLAKNMDKTELFAYYDDTVAQTLSWLSKFEDTQFNRIPFEGSWTPSQVGEHLLLSVVNPQKMMQGHTQPTTDRQPDDKIETLKAILLDFNTKIKAELAIMPTDAPNDKQELIGKISAVMAEIRESCASFDLSQTCTDAPFATMGLLTRWEWLNFIAFHFQRHIFQLKNIYSSTHPQAE